MKQISTIKVRGVNGDIDALYLGEFVATVGGKPFDFVVVHIPNEMPPLFGELPVANVTHKDSGMRASFIGASLLAAHGGDYVSAGKEALRQKVAQLGEDKARLTLVNWRKVKKP